MVSVRAILRRVGMHRRSDNNHDNHNHYNHGRRMPVLLHFIHAMHRRWLRKILVLGIFKRFVPMQNRLRGKRILRAGCQRMLQFVELCDQTVLYSYYHDNINDYDNHDYNHDNNHHNHYDNNQPVRKLEQQLQQPKRFAGAIQEQRVMFCDVHMPKRIQHQGDIIRLYRAQL